MIETQTKPHFFCHVCGYMRSPEVCTKCGSGRPPREIRNEVVASPEYQKIKEELK